MMHPGQFNGGFIMVRRFLAPAFIVAALIVLGAASSSASTGRSVFTHNATVAPAAVNPWRRSGRVVAHEVILWVERFHPLIVC